jgi:hypothetical protein
MGIFELILILVIVGVLMWLVNTYIPMEAGIKKLLNIAVIVIMVIFVINAMGVFSNFHDISVNSRVNR